MSLQDGHLLYVFDISRHSVDQYIQTLLGKCDERVIEL